MKQVIASLLAFSISWLCVPSAAAAEQIKISHQRSACVPSEGQTKLQCDVSPATSVASVRVYFRSEAFKDDYFLEMRRGGAADHFYAVLPKVDSSVTKGVKYRIVVKTADGAETATALASVPVSGNCPVSLADDERKYATNLVVGLTVDGQPSVPEGFKCEGIVSVITATGEMKSHEECRKMLAAGAGTGSSSIPTAAYVAAGAAAAAGGGLILSNNSGGGGKVPVSSARPAAQPTGHD